MNKEDEYLAHTYGMRPIEIVRGAGALVYDSTGKEYLDCMTGVGVALLGHSHPKVVEAIKAQAEKLVTGYGILYNDQRAAFAEKLSTITPGDLNTSFLSNSGAESVECALKLARKYTGKAGIIAMKRGFHGKTMGALSATWKPTYKKAFEPLVPGFSQVAFGDVDELQNAISPETAAVLMEPIQGESGVILPPEGYLNAVRDVCADKKVLLIFDECQTFGRTGNFFAAQTFGVTPDVTCAAKGIGGGVPMGVTASTAEIFNAFSVGDHTSTFGGNPLACAAGLAGIQAIQDEDLLQKGSEVGKHLLSLLRKLESNDVVREARGIGVMSAIEFKFPSRKLLKYAMEHSILLMASGRNIVRFLPPLILTKEQAEQAVKIVEDGLNANSVA